MVKFSIIIPVKAINDYVRETVPYIQALNSNQWELIILPNEVDLNEWGDDRIKVVSSGRVGPAAKRDMGAKLAQGEILVFLDDDSYPESNLLSVASPYFDSDNVVAIGGPAITPSTDSFWQKVSGAVFLSKYSGGNPERYLPDGEVREVDDWPSVNFMVRRDDFINIGGFNTDYWPGEDTKLCHDLLLGSELKIMYVPNLIVWHHRRPGLIKHLNQIGSYGLHRGYFAKIYPKNSRKLKYFIPSIFFIFNLYSFYIIYKPINNIIYIKLIWFLYIILLIISAIKVFKYYGLGVAFFSLAYIYLTHNWYGLRFIQGIFSGKKFKSKLR